MKQRQVTQKEIRQIAEMMEKRQIPVHVWLPIMHLESGGNVMAHNPHGEDSRGLFQINLQAGPGGRDTPDFVRELNLFNPIINTHAILSNYWLGNQDLIRRMLGMSHSPGEQAAYAYRRGIRPRWTPELEARIRHLSTEGLRDLMRRYGLDETPEGRRSPEWLPDPFANVLPQQGSPEWLPDPFAGVTIPREQIEVEEEAPDWLPNPFARLWWEIVNVWRKGWLRALIIVAGIPLLIWALGMLFLSERLSFKPQRLLGAATGGALEIKEKEEN